jgi:hypothetical protein
LVRRLIERIAELLVDARLDLALAPKAGGKPIRAVRVSGPEASERASGRVRRA